MAWFYLFLAGVCEIAWAITLKYSVTHPLRGPLGLVNWLLVLAMAISVVSILLLAAAIREPPEIPVGTAYAVWTGIGAMGVAMLGMALFGEPPSLLRFACIGLIVLGIAGLKFTMKEPTQGSQDAKVASDPAAENRTQPSP